MIEQPFHPVPAAAITAAEAAMPSVVAALNRGDTRDALEMVIRAATPAVLTAYQHTLKPRELTRPEAAEVLFGDTTDLRWDGENSILSMEVVGGPKSHLWVWMSAGEDIETISEYKWRSIGEPL